MSTVALVPDDGLCSQQSKLVKDSIRLADANQVNRTAVCALISVLHISQNFGFTGVRMAGIELPTFTFGVGSLTGLTCCENFGPCLPNNSSIWGLQEG